MHRRNSLLSRHRPHAVFAITCMAVIFGLPGQPATAQTMAQQHQSFSLKEAFDSAWSRQPEARSLSAREEAGTARREAASSLTAEPVALEILSKTDRLNRNQGSREYEVGIALPLWLPGERSRSIALAEAEIQTLSAKVAAARLRTAASVREAYWSWQRAIIELALARDRLDSARALATDVARRVHAGDLSRADQHQADGNLAAAESAFAESQALLAATQQQMRQITGIPLQPNPDAIVADASQRAETLPRIKTPAGSPENTHPDIADPAAQAEAARRAADLARVQTRANPELTLSTSRERGDFADRYQQTITVGLRIPFGSGARHRSKNAQALAEALEADTQLLLAEERVAAESEAARQRVESARLVADAANKRARLARETRGFFEKSFRAGETDLPTRLRIELEAIEAERQAQRTQIDYAASISALRQAMGLLPE